MKIREIPDVGEIARLHAAEELAGAFRVPIDLYHGGPGIGSSDLRQILRSPRHYLQAKDEASKRRAQSEPGPDAEAQEAAESAKDAVKAGRSQILGSAVHAAILEPEKFDDMFWVRPTDINRRTKVGKAEWASLVERNRGKTEIDQKTLNEALAIAESVTKHSVASKYLADLHDAEVSFYVKDDVVKDVLRKVRPDILTAENVILDLKTTRDARAEDFVRSVVRYGYDVQAAYYVDTLSLCEVEPSDFIFLVVETSPPYEVAMYRPNHEFFDRGRRLYREAMVTFDICQKTNRWSGYPTEIKTLAAPKWLASGFGEIEQEDDEW